jgi:hypothetical protein
MKTFAIAGLLLLLGCGGDDICITQPDPQAVQVIVVSREDGAAVIDGLRGTLQDGAYLEEMSVWEGNKLGGAWGRAGIYDVRVEASGFEPWVKEDVRARRDECHLITVRLTAEMTPE